MRAFAFCDKVNLSVHVRVLMDTRVYFNVKPLSLAARIHPLHKGELLLRILAGPLKVSVPLK